MARQYLFLLLIFHSFNTCVKAGSVALIARKYTNGEPVYTGWEAGNLLQSATYRENGFLYSTYIVPATYNGDILIMGGGEQASDLYDWTYNSDSRQFVAGSPVQLNWVGPNIYEKGLVEKSLQGNREVSSVPRPGGGAANLHYEYYIKVKAPQTSSTYSFSYAQKITDPDGVVSVRSINARIVIVRGQSIPTSLRHYHELNTSPIFNTPKFLNVDNFSVCADGSDASTFSMELSDQGTLNKKNLGIRIKSGENEDIYGKFSSINYGINGFITVRYKHPNYIAGRNSTAILIIEVFLIDEPLSIVGSYTMNIYRAPVLMVHGLWSDREAFYKLEQELKELYSIYPYTFSLTRRADYMMTNSLAFDANVPKIKAEIDELILNLRNANVAAGAVDYIGHSMGGILGRLYLQGDTYQVGIHKLITLNTPHSGSQLANLLIYAPKFTELLCYTLIPLFTSTTSEACDGGALVDLCVDSRAITATLNGLRRNFRTTSSHTLVTVEYQTPGEILTGLFKNIGEETALEPTLKNATKGISDYTFTDVLPHMVLDIFSNQLFDGLNDLVVSQVSQQGGMMGNCTTLIENQAHSASASNDKVIQKIINLLSESPGSNSFCQFFNPVNLRSPAVALNPPNGSINITSPKKGQFVRANTEVSIKANSANIEETKVIAEFSPTQVVTGRTNNNEIICKMPVSDLTGPKKVIVIGKTTSGGYVFDSTYFYVSYKFCESIQSGNWDSPSTWTCGHQPTSTDIVIINSGHTITVSTHVQAQQIIYNGGKTSFPVKGAKVFVKGSD